MLIGVPSETVQGETRVAVTPETAKKLKAQGHGVHVQSGAGAAASATDEAYVGRGRRDRRPRCRVRRRPGAQGARAAGGRTRR